MMSNNVIIETAPWKNESDWKSLSSVEYVPLCILVIEGLLGVLCNLTAAVVYWKQRRGLCQSPGNVFTVSLIVDDLILSGIAIPLIIAIETVDNSRSIAMDHLCLGARCTLMFSAVSSATGNALLALDRADLTLRPSKRFFRPQQAATAVVLAWSCSILSMITPLWTSFAMKQRDEEENRTIYVKEMAAWSDDVDRDVGMTQCNVTCRRSYCALSDVEFAVRCAIQTTFFLSAAVTIVITYRKILRYVKKRDVKRDRKNINLSLGLNGSRKKTKLRLERWCKCLQMESDASLIEKSPTNKGIQNRENGVTPACANPKNEAIRNATEGAGNRLIPGREIANRVKPVDGRQSEMHPGRAHFASVALTVQAFIALKRIVREKSELKRKKHRHLQRMTTTITLSFLICWAPFHALPFIRYMTNQFPQDLSMCKLNTCFLNGTVIGGTEHRSVFVDQPKPAVNVVFLWSIVLASLSSIANPLLYSFSREKVRQKLNETFCVSKAKRSQANGDASKKKQHDSKCSDASVPLNGEAASGVKISFLNRSIWSKKKQVI